MSVVNMPPESPYMTSDFVAILMFLKSVYDFLFHNSINASHIFNNFQDIDYRKKDAYLDLDIRNWLRTNMSIKRLYITSYFMALLMFVNYFTILRHSLSKSSWPWPWPLELDQVNYKYVKQKSTRHLLLMAIGILFICVTFSKIFTV